MTNKKNNLVQVKSSFSHNNFDIIILKALFDNFQRHLDVMGLRQTQVSKVESLNELKGK